MRGTIQVVFKHGFGFIRASSQRDRWFHASAVIEPDAGFAVLEQGDVVAFTPEDHPKGPRAVGVRLLAKAGDFVHQEVQEDT